MEDRGLAQKPCPICGYQKTPATVHPKIGDFEDIDCVKCGRYRLMGTAARLLQKGYRSEGKNVAVLSHFVRKSDQPEKRVRVDPYLLDRLKSELLPTPKERADNLILSIGKRSTLNPGHWHKVNYEIEAAVIGAIDEQDAVYIAEQMQSKGYLIFNGNPVQTKLTMDGWEVFEQITRATRETRLAFMAMPFKDELIARIFEEHFKPAVAETGFDLRKLNDEEKAGLIDDRLRVEIRRSRFLISELTGHNEGAYWEAGFAEGLGLPVIYTCEKSEFEKTHFDTNHLTTVIWEEDKLNVACARLKGIIRNSFPSEAKQEDPT